MKKREKMLVAVAGTIVGLLLGYVALSRFVIDPARDLRAKADEIRAKIRKAEDEKQKGPAYQSRYREIAAETLGIDEMKVSEELRTRITEVLTASGLSATNLSLKPLIGSRVPGVYKEIGWLVRARGKLPEIVKFLFLMSKEPALHRLDNMSLTPVPNSGDVEIQVKFATLVLEVPTGEKVPIGPVTPLLVAEVLPQLDQYDGIKARDLFRPYIKRPPPPPTAPQQPTEAAAVPTARPTTGPAIPEPPRGKYRLVGLSAFGGFPDVEVSDTSTGRVARYKQGDELAGGRIITVDYRPLPKPSNPALLSLSRVVLQVGYEYHAIEIGDWLTNKHKLTVDQLPPGLPMLVAPPPEPKVETKTDAKGGPRPDSKSGPRTDGRTDGKGQRT